jgi:hypothetical protein
MTLRISSGPWRVVPPDASDAGKAWGGYWIETGRGLTLQCCEVSQEPPEALANARLVAAAPALFVAAERALRGFEPMIKANDLTPGEREQVDLLRSAIRLAKEGE